MILGKRKLTARAHPAWVGAKVSREKGRTTNLLVLPRVGREGGGRTWLNSLGQIPKQSAEQL